MFKFHGESDHTLDEKNRIIIPVKYRDALADGLFLTRGLDGCLWLYPLSTWEDLSANLEASNQKRRDARHLDRLLYSGTPASLDKQGRMLIPNNLRAHAGLVDNHAVIVGVKNRLEIWSRERWAIVTELLADEEAEFAERLAELGQ